MAILSSSAFTSMAKVYWCLFFLSLFFLFINSSMSCLLEHEKALLRFKSSLIKKTTSSLPSMLQTWSSSTNCCEWEGVTCSVYRLSSNSSQPVIELRLSALANGYSMVNLSPLFEIKTLTRLDATLCGLQGEIPAMGLLRLSQLEQLDLSMNNLNGSIPLEIGKLSNLQYLSIGSNQLTGEIPAKGILSLSQLKELDLSENLLNGRIPPEMGKLSNLQFLSLASNQLTGEIPAKGLLRLSQLKELDLSKNQLHGSIPPEIGKLSKLEYLDVSNNYLNGSIPSQIYSLMKLKELCLSNNSFSGTLGREIENLTKLEVLQLDVNKLTGVLPPSLFAQTLSFIDLSRNALEGELPKNIGNASLLTLLLLSNNNFNGSLPVSVSNLSSLYLLDLSNNFFSGDILPAFKAAPSILSFSHNHFSSIPMSMPNASLLDLTVLDLSDNDITGELPLYLAEMTSLEILNLRGNSIGGLIPASLSTLQNLFLLDLSSNQLTGEIPSELGNLPYFLQFHQNNFSPLTMEYYFVNMTVEWKGKKKHVKYTKTFVLLDLSNNQLSGQIPSTLGNLTGLKSLNLSFNGLTGKIPTSLGELKHVESLSLAHNMLSGEIPQSFVKLGELTTLNLSNNNLVGKIPMGGQMSSMADLDSYANNSGLCGIQIQVECEPAEAPLGLNDDEEEDQTWFSWEAILLGYVVGFWIAIGSAFFVGIFDPFFRPKRSS